jgi:gluconokinase
VSTSFRAAPPSVIVLIGPAGAGKTTVGRALAAALGWDFYDADAFHAAESIARMRRGVPLTDADREPWLAELRALLARAVERGRRLVLACSALRAAHRRALVPDDAPVGTIRFVYLDVPEPLLRRRLTTRAHHFAEPSLLESQIATLEPPDDDEALRVDGRRPVAELVTTIRDALAV